MHIIITGASGFIGRNLILGLPKSWRITALYHRSKDFPQFLKSHKISNVKAFSCDLSEGRDVRRLALKAGKRFDACVYLAANGNPAVSVDHPLFDLQSNGIALVNFLRYIQIKRLIYFSSGAVYEGRKGKIAPPMTLNPTLPYAISKYASEQYVKHFQKTGQVKEYGIVRFFGAYGPYEPGRKVYTNLVKTFFIERKNKFTVRGNGKNFIDAMYVDDAVNAIFRIIKGQKKNFTVDCCSGTAVSINDLVRTAARVFKVKGLKIAHKGTVPESNHFFASPRGMREYFGFHPLISLEEGLKRFSEFLTEKS